MDQTTISAIIIDDEPDAINLLEMYLRQFPSVKVIGKENRAKQGLELVKEKLPELVFLDIDMPDMNGLKVADKIQAENFYSEIVFTTAHQHYAYDALNIEPLDFLTKPFFVSDLEQVIQKYKAKIEKKKHEKKLDVFLNSQANSTKIKFPTTRGVLFIDIKNIVILRSKANNCDVYMDDGTLETVTRNLYKVVNRLDSPAFFQVSRSTYININYLQRVDKKSFKCIISYNQTILEEPISRSKMIHFDKIIKFPFHME
jgi:two-component system LytT family response regulator